MSSSTKSASASHPDVDLQYDSGPLPSVEALKEYEKISPGFASRLIELAEQQVIHRQRLEEALIQTESRSRYLGLGVAALLTAGIVILAEYTQFPSAAVTAIFAAIVGYLFRSARKS